MYWYEKRTDGTSPVLSTRVRFARNLENTPFPALLTREQKEEVFSRIKSAYQEKKPLAISFGDVDQTVKEAYVQTRLASAALAKKGGGCGLLLSEDGEVSLMINEEDHIRLQVIQSGKKILSAFEKAVEWAKLGEEKLPLAYRDGLGYLTSCPTNLGAAMRISVMIHLPAITSSGAMPRLIQNLNNAGFTVRGVFGEGSRESGSIYQISNQTSREKSPLEIVNTFEKVIEQVEEMEKKGKQAMLERDRIALEDRVSRAAGTLKFAKKMSYGEFISLYSQVRFGKEAGLAEAQGMEELDRLFVELMPAPMLLQNITLRDEELRDIRRSEILRERLNHKEE